MKKKIKFKTLPNTCEKKYSSFYKNIDEKIIDSFSLWEKKYFQIFENMKRAYKKNSIKMIGKLNNVWRGPIYLPNSENNIIEVKNMNKWFSNKIENNFQQILFNVNLKIKEGEFVVIIGESGSGKTTLLNILSGIERPSNGEVIVSNHNLICMNEFQLINFRRDFVSIIFQNYALIPNLTVLENVESGAVTQENIRRRLDPSEILELLLIDKQKYKFPKDLSGGQQQRCSIAKAIAKNAKILFADEPTGAVDEKTGKDILRIFNELNENYGTTVVLITHNNLIAEIADKVVRISRGKILEVIVKKRKKVDDINWKQKN